MWQTLQISGGLSLTPAVEIGVKRFGGAGGGG